MAWTSKDLTALQNDVYAALRDSERVFTSVATVTSWLNEAYLDLCARLGVPQVTATGSTGSDGTIALPTDLLEVKRLYIGAQTLTWVDSEVFLSYSVPEIIPNSTIYRIWNEVIETWPVAETQAYVLEYLGTPTAMAAGTDTPTELPPELHLRLVAYARAQAKIAEGELEEADRFMAQYERGLPDLPRATWRHVPGPITLLPLPNIVDGEWVN